MQDRVCVITGANAGLGKEIVRGLASQGARVLMVCRNEDKGRAALEEIQNATGSQKLELLQADLSSQASLRRLSQVLHERYSALHVLIHNASVLLKEKCYSVDQIEMTLATNYLGPFLMTHLLLDLLKAGAPSRIINVSCAIHHWARLDLDDLQFARRRYLWLKAYGQSKLLLNVATLEWARRLQGSQVTVNCLDPGMVNTALGDSSSNNAFFFGMKKFIERFFSTPQAAVETPLYLAASKAVENITGKYFVKCETRFSKAAAYQSEEVRKLWEISERLTGIQQHF